MVFFSLFHFVLCSLICNFATIFDKYEKASIHYYIYKYAAFRSSCLSNDRR